MHINIIRPFMIKAPKRSLAFRVCDKTLSSSWLTDSSLIHILNKINWFHSLIILLQNLFNNNHQLSIRSSEP